MTIRSARKKMVIISSYFSNETYGLLGPQMAATIIQENTPYDCHVIAVTREDDLEILKKVLADYFGTQQPVIGFSNLSGREELFALARDLKEEGALTLLAGPQTDVDILGETGWEDFPHRFKGFSSHFSYGLHGPAEQIIGLLAHPESVMLGEIPGLLFVNGEKQIVQNPKQAWDERFLTRVRWENMLKIEKSSLVPHPIATAQVLQHIGCPHAVSGRRVEIDLPVFLQSNHSEKIRIISKGCSFCDVAVDKGFYGTLSHDAVMCQIAGIPEGADGRKIPFELINENPLPGLYALLRGVKASKIQLTAIHLTLRADWLIRGEEHLRAALHQARDMEIRIVLTSVGFESFDDGILRSLNKGLKVRDNLEAVFLMRKLKEEFPDQWGYARDEGANHGFIHPTPWDTEETEGRIQNRINRHALSADILPRHSVPLIIHHASALGDWIREVEKITGTCFRRYGSIIGWWQEAVICDHNI